MLGKNLPLRGLIQDATGSDQIKFPHPLIHKKKEIRFSIAYFCLMIEVKQTRQPAEHVHNKSY